VDVFSRILKESVESLESVGISARITHKGKDLFRGAAGYADKEQKIPFTCDNLIRIFSMTKIITGVAVLKLFEQGYFSLDEPISKYLPMFKDMKVISYDEAGNLKLVPAKNPITIRHLFTMTSGISYQIQTVVFDYPRHFQDARAFADEILNKASRTPNLTSKQMLEAIASIPLAFEPGTEWLYGPSSDVIAGLLEAITHKSFGEYLKEEIFVPMGMENTCHRPTAEMLDKLAVLYDYSNPANIVPYDTNAYNILHSEGSTNEHFVGALFSTLDDFTAFQKMMVNGGVHDGKRIIGKNTLELMRQDHLTDWQFNSLKRTINPTGSSSWGLMCRVAKTLTNSLPYLNPGSYGWGGWAGTQAYIDPDNELTITMMVQRVPSFSYSVFSKLSQTAYGMIN